MIESTLITRNCGKLYPMKKLCVLLFTLVGCFPDALADVPVNTNKPMDYARIASPVWGHWHTAPQAASIAGFVAETSTTAAVADVHLFEFGTIVVVSCQTNPATFCWVMDTDETTMTTAGIVTDTDTGAGGGNDGVGSCFRVQAGTYKDVTLWRDNFRAANKVGRRQGYCTVNTTTADWPCDADADCSTLGVCARTVDHGLSPFDHIDGAFLLSRAGTASSCFISEEK